MQIWTAWLIFAGVCFILEIATEGFLICWLGVGALCAMGLSFVLPDAIFTQIALMAVVSIILILCTRKFAKKISSKDNTPMNVYTILGKKATVTQSIDNIKGQGQIKIDGDMWSARNEDGEEPIAEGSTVEVIRIEGVKAMVRRV